MHLLLAALLLATPVLAAAQGTPADTAPPPAEQALDPTARPEPRDLPPPSATATQVQGEGEAEPRLKLLGAQLSAGAPQGIALSAVVRPLKWVRGSLGFAHNILGPGIQGSVTLVPFHWAVTPTFTLEAGRFFETDVSDDLDGAFPSAFDPSLRKFGYTFYSAQLGLEFGSQRHFLFFLRGGLAWVRSGLDGVQDFRPEDSNTTVDVSNVDLSATVPTVNLGFLLYVW